MDITQNMSLGAFISRAYLVTEKVKSKHFKKFMGLVDDELGEFMKGNIILDTDAIIKLAVWLHESPILFLKIQADSSVSELAKPGAIK